jgi:hypothetical protein
MPAKRRALIVTVVTSAAALATPLPSAGQWTAGTEGEPRPKGTNTSLERTPPPAVPLRASEPPGEVEPPPQAADEVVAPATVDVAEPVEPAAAVVEPALAPHPKCMTVTKMDYIAPPVEVDESVTDEPDPEAEAAAAVEVADDPVDTGDTADVADADADGMIVEVPADTVEPDAELPADADHA